MKTQDALAGAMRPPGLVAGLGYGGLIPFVGLAIFRGIDWLGQADLWASLLIAYGAVILSFVGALHWGFAMMSGQMDQRLRAVSYTWSVIPALMAFLAIGLNASLSITLMVAGFALAYWRDAVLANRVALPAWYPRLRAHLSLVASLCLLSGLIPTA